jgi:sulfur carrier protein
MITISVNGEQKQLDRSLSLLDAIQLWSLSEKQFAVAVNQQFIPKALYEETHLEEGDNIELLIPMQGG